LQKLVDLLQRALKRRQIHADLPQKEGDLEPDDCEQTHDHDAEQDFSHCEHSLNA